jgi:hypothetical protein
MKRWRDGRIDRCAIRMRGLLTRRRGLRVREGKQGDGGRNEVLKNGGGGGGGGRGGGPSGARRMFRWRKIRIDGLVPWMKDDEGGEKDEMKGINDACHPPSFSLACLLQASSPGKTKVICNRTNETNHRWSNHRPPAAGWESLFLVLQRGSALRRWCGPPLLLTK